MLRIIEQKIESDRAVTFRWESTHPRAVYFKIYVGVHPKELQHFATTFNVSIGNVPLTKNQIDGSTFVSIEAYNDQNQQVDKVDFRITAGEIRNYLKYRKHFERNFLKASLKSAAGVTVALLQKRFSGTMCPLCADKMTGEARDPNCPTCFGTGYSEVFYPPIIVNGLKSDKSRGVAAHQGQPAPTVQVQQSFIMPPYPMMKTNDIIVDLSTYHYYEVLNRGQQSFEMDHQRLGSVVYTTQLLPANHPLTKWDISKKITSLGDIEFPSTTEIKLNGTELLVNYGIVYLSLRNMEHTDPFTIDEATLYYDDILSMTNEAIAFKIPERFSTRHTRYRFVINNTYFEGDLNAT